MKSWNMRGHRGGLSTLVSTLVLIVLVVGGLVGIALYYSTIASGAVSQPHLVFAGSLIKVNAADGTGYVYVRLYNEGPGAIRISEIDINGTTMFVFTSTTCGATTCVINGNPGTGVVGNNLIVPAGATVSIRHDYASANPFQPGTVYSGLVIPTAAAEQPFTIPSESAP